MNLIKRGQGKELEIAQWLRILVALLENPGLILSTYTVAHSHL